MNPPSPGSDADAGDKADDSSPAPESAPPSSGIIAKPSGGCEHPRAERGRRIEAKLRAHAAVADHEFDDLYPLLTRGMSQTFWTPVDVALRAARWLVTRPGSRVLDVGSGAGKFCIVGALATEGEFVGVEQREQLVEVARDVATLAGAKKATFLLGDFDALHPGDYDAFYFFNPFEENLWPKLFQYDWSVPISEERFAEDVRNARLFLEGAKDGARVVTYNGMGGALPPCYELVEKESRDCALELWVRRTRAPGIEMP